MKLPWDYFVPPECNPVCDLKTFELEVNDCISSWCLQHTVSESQHERFRENSKKQRQIYLPVNPRFRQATVTLPCLHCDWRAGSSVSRQINQPANTAAEQQNKTKALESCFQTAPEEVTLSQKGSKSESNDSGPWQMCLVYNWLYIHRKYFFLQHAKRWI